MVQSTRGIFQKHAPIKSCYAKGMRAAIIAGLLAAFVCPASPGELHNAARAGDLQRVRSLLAAGASVTERDSLGGTPLHDAAWGGDVAIVQLLLDKGADPNARHLESGST